MSKKTLTLPLELVAVIAVALLVSIGFLAGRCSAPAACGYCEEIRAGYDADDWEERYWQEWQDNEDHQNAEYDRLVYGAEHSHPQRLMAIEQQKVLERAFEEARRRRAEKGGER